MENEVKYYNDEIRCYRDGTIERKREEWKEWRKSEGKLIKINKEQHLRGRIIAKCFLDIPPEGEKYQVRHINGDTGDCKVSNLQIVIQGESIPIIRRWEGIKSYTAVGEDGKNTKRFKVMFKGEIVSDHCAYSYAKFSYDTKLGKKWIWRIITKESRENKLHYLERGRAETQEEAEIIGKYELLKVKEKIFSEEHKHIWILEVYEDN
jgi:hypothetical protein